MVEIGKNQMYYAGTYRYPCYEEDNPESVVCRLALMKCPYPLQGILIKHLEVPGHFHMDRRAWRVPCLLSLLYCCKDHKVTVREILYQGNRYTDISDIQLSDGFAKYK